MKRCSRCKEEKDISEFYRDKRKSDGLYPHCKSCHMIYTNMYGSTEKGKEGKRSYWTSRVGREKQKARAKKYSMSEKGKEKITEYSRSHYKERYLKEDKNKIRARWAVGNAVRGGKMPRASTLKCHECGEKAREYHHHNGYERKFVLDVVPVCKPCHIKLDKAHNAPPNIPCNSDRLNFPALSLV